MSNKIIDFLSGSDDYLHRATLSDIQTAFPQGKIARNGEDIFITNANGDAVLKVQDGIYRNKELRDVIADLQNGFSLKCVDILEDIKIKHPILLAIIYPRNIHQSLIRNNPYRISGILANATTREIQSRKAKISAFARVGKEVTSEYDFPFLPSFQRDENNISKAFSDIEQNQNKIKHALFWFVNTNAIDKTAIAHLISGNKEKAIEIWEKLTDDREIHAKNYSAFNNIGTLYLLGDAIEEIKAVLRQR